MKKILSMVLIASMIVLAAPAFAVLDDNSTNATATATGGAGGSATGGSATGGSSSVRDSGNSSARVGDISNRNTNDNSNRNSNSVSSRNSNRNSQRQSQTANGTVNVTGDSEKHVVGESLWMNAPSTVAGAGQQASSVYSIFGGVNLAQTQEYVICKEKIDVITTMKANGYLTAEEALAEARDAFQQLKDNTQVKRVLWIGPKTRGVHAGNLFGMLAMDSCNEFNTDNWMGVKNIKLPKKAK